MITVYPINFISNGGGGGGGDTDLTIANVKITNQALGGSVDINTSFAFDENEMRQGSPAYSYPSFSILSNEEITFKVIMYKGCAYLWFNATFPYSVIIDGDVERTQYGDYLITGDATLTIEGGGIS